VAGAVGQSLAVGPIASVAVFGGFLAGYAGGASGFPILVAAVGALALAVLVADYARHVAGAGAVYEYAGWALGAPTGIFTAFVYALALTVVSTGGGVLLLGILGEGFAAGHLGFDPPWWAVGLVSLAVVVALTVRGVRVAVGAQLALAALSAVPVIVLVVTVVARGGAAGNTLSVFSPLAAHRGPQVFRGLIFALTLFAGFEAAASLGEESARPYRTIPRALVLTVLLAAGWYAAVVYAAVIGFGPADAARWASDPAGLSTLAGRYVGRWDATAIEVAVLLDLLGVAMATANTAARTAFALARDGLWPRPLARTSERHGTPVGGIALVGAATLLVLGVVAAAAHGPSGRMAAVGALAVAGSLVVQGVYLVLVLGAARRALRERAPARAAMVLVAAAVPVLGVYGTVVPFPAGASAWAVGAAAAVAAGSAAGTAWLAWRRARTVQAASRGRVRAEHAR
jgi:amino acid transporter